MKCSARVLATKTDEKGRLLAKIQLNGKSPKEGTIVSVRWGRVRSGSQNRLYWAWLQWLVSDGGMKDQGYMFAEELHDALKNRLLCSYETRGFKTVKIKSTTDLTKDEFVEYMDSAEKLIEEYCGVSSLVFWKEYEDFYGNY